MSADQPLTGDEREARYADALAAGHTADAEMLRDWLTEARSAMAVADAEHAELVAEIERLREELEAAEWARNT